MREIDGFVTDALNSGAGQVGENRHPAVLINDRLFRFSARKFELL